METTRDIWTIITQLDRASFSCKTLFFHKIITVANAFLRCSSFHWLTVTWLVTHIVVANAKMHRLLLYCAHIHYMVSTNIQQRLMSISCWFFFSSLAWTNSMRHQCFVCLFRSETIFSLLFKTKQKKMIGYL